MCLRTKTFKFSRRIIVSNLDNKMPTTEDIEELKRELRKLRPRARLKRLKELEEKRKAEMTDIDELIKDSEKEVRTEEVAEEISPEQEEINIGRLFREEGEELERTVREAAPAIEEEENQRYASFKQAYKDYSTLQEIAYESMEGPLTSKQMERVDKMMDARQGEIEKEIRHDQEPVRSRQEH